jgi:hypothetical protein
VTWPSIETASPPPCATSSSRSGRIPIARG